MNSLELRLQQLNPGLLSKFHETIEAVNLLLQQYAKNFPSYTDHSLNHTMQVFQIASDMLTKDEIDNLNGEELYVLSMACILHDIGMCIPEKNLIESDRYVKYSESNPNITLKEILIRDIHHELSYDFILQEQNLLKIPNGRYAEAIALVAMGHRKVQLDDTSLYKPKCFVKDGRDFVCLPYLASVLRLADELDITNIRTPQLLTKYYMPDNEKSIVEWKKHIATTQINYTEDQVIFKVTCSDQNNLAALEDQFEKIQNVSNYSQKIIRNISNTDDRRFKLQLNRVIPEYTYLGFDPKGIKFSFNVNNVVNTFIGKDLYDSELVALREVIQNAIDSCRYKTNLQGEDYTGSIEIYIDDNSISITDNGLGMDEFIIQNFFGQLGSSFYTQEKVKDNYEAIGQFGVGVFSYFLLGEYIDIETKTKDSQTLKFRMDKDPKNYFHFYDNFSRTNSGTTITLHFNESTKGKYAVTDYVDYIKSIFRHVEIPITIESHDKIPIKIVGLPPVCLKKAEVEQLIKIQYRDRIDKLQTISHKIISEELEGECSLIIPFSNEEIELSQIEDLFEYEAFECCNSTHEYSTIKISQKGVYVNNYANDFLSYTIGCINLKKSKKIKISRNQFSNEAEVEKTLNIFAIELINKLFKASYKKIKPEDRIKISNDFLEYYFRLNYRLNQNTYSEEITNKLKKVFGEYIFVEVYSNAINQIMSLNNLYATYKEFIVISSSENRETIHEIFKLPVVIGNGSPIFSGAFTKLEWSFTTLFGLESSIISHNRAAYLKLNHYENIKDNRLKRKFRKLAGWNFSEVIKFDSNVICHSLVMNKPEFESDYIYHSGILINREHAFVKLTLENIDLLNDDNEMRKIIKESYQFIYRIFYKDLELANGIQRLNKIIKPLNTIGISYDFSTEDFKIVQV